MTSPASSPQRTGLDTAGAVCSSLCAAHCAATATAPALLTALGLGALVSSSFEWGATIIAVAFGVAAFAMGWRRHRSTWVLGALALGIVGLTAGRLLEVAEVHGVGPVVSIAGGLALATGHIAGLVLARRAARSA